MIIILHCNNYCLSVKTGPNNRSGVVIVEVIPNSSADNAGLKVSLITPLYDFCNLVLHSLGMN